MSKHLKTLQGDVLTEEVIDALADEAERGYTEADWTGRILETPGRPPLSRAGDSVQLRVRVEPELNQDVRAIAEQEGRSLSALTRDALREYVKRHAA